MFDNRSLGGQLCWKQTRTPLAEVAIERIALDLASNAVHVLRCASHIFLPNVTLQG